MDRRTLQVILLGCLAASGMLPGEPATAATRTLAVPDAYPTIKAAMAAADHGDIILVQCGTYREHGIRVTPGVKLWSGTLQPECVVIDAEGRGRVFLFSECDTTTSVVGFTLRNGFSDQDGGAILCRDSSPRLNRVLIENSHARRGGGLASVGHSQPRLVDCVLSANTADLLGGGVFWDSAGSGRLEQCTFTGNAAVAGGGLACRGGRLLLDRVVFSGNEAAGSGGAAWLGGGAATFERCLLARNHGGLAGGAVAVRGAEATLIGCTVADNAAEAQGGGVLARAAALHLRRTIVAFNDADAIAGGAGTALNLLACNVFGHDGGDWTGLLAGLANRDGNFSLDPAFCSRQAGGYHLRRGSPCLPGGRGGATVEMIGAHPHGCD